jgi:hypothetical protein
MGYNLKTVNFLKWITYFFVVLIIGASVISLSRWTIWDINKFFSNSNNGGYFSEQQLASVTLIPGTSSELILGAETLQAYDAEEQHVLLTDIQGRVFLQNITSESTDSLAQQTQNAQAIVTTKSLKRYLREWKLDPGDEIVLGENTIKIIERKGENIVLEVSSGGCAKIFEIKKDKALRISDNGNNSCYTNTMGKCSVGNSMTEHKRSLAAFFSNWGKDHTQNLYYPVSIGGRIICNKLIPLKNVEKGAFILDYRGGDFFLRPKYLNNLDKWVVKRKSENSNKWEYLADNKLEVTPFLNNGGFNLKIGYSVYAVQKVQVENFGSGYKFVVEGVVGKNGSLNNFVGEFRDYKPNFFNGFWGLFAILLVALSVFLGELVKEGDHSLGYLTIAALELASIFLALFLIWRMFDVSSIIVAMAGAMVILIYRYRSDYLSLILVVSVILLSLCNIEYGKLLDAHSLSNKYLIDFTKQIRIFCFGFFIWTFFSSVHTQVRRFFKQALNYVLYGFFYKVFAKIDKLLSKGLIKYTILFLLITSSFFLLFLWGDETGIGGFQPSELFKLFLSVIFAIFLSKFIRELLEFFEEYRPKTKWSYLALMFREVAIAAIPLMIFGLSLLVYTFLIHDFSYFILIISSIICLTWWCMGKILISKCKSNIFLHQLLYLTLPLLVVFISTFTIATLIPAAIQSDFLLKFSNNYSDRVNVWKDGSGYYPYAGHQVNQAIKWAKIEDERKSSSRSGDISDEMYANTIIFSVPRIDDDFALTGWKASYNGVLPKEILFFSLLCLLFSLMYIAHENRVPYNLTVPPLFGYEPFIVSIVGFLVGNIYISFCTNFQLLPVMGQPFPFLGRQGSFLILFMFPTLWLVAFGRPIDKAGEVNANY